MAIAEVSCPFLAWSMGESEIARAAPMGWWPGGPTATQFATPDHGSQSFIFNILQN
jgi:hypothetical protein